MVIEMSNNTGLIIKKIRTENSISQSMLARKAGLSQSFLSDIESGNKSPTIRSIYKISDALQIKPEILLSENKNIKQETSIKLKRQRKIEEKINVIAGQIYKSITGHGPKSLKSRTVEDIIVIKCKCYPEKFMTALLQTKEGESEYKRIIELIFNNYKDEFIKNIEKILDLKVEDVYYNKKLHEETIIITIFFSENILD